MQVVFDAVLSSARGRSNSFVRGVALRWDGVVCGQQQFSASALNTFAGVDIASFSRLADDVVGWNQRALDLNATVARMVPVQIGCAGVPADIVDPVRTKLPAFLTALTADLDRIDPNDFRPISGVAHTDSPFDLLFKVRAAQVFDLAAHLAFLGAADLKAPTVRVVTGQLDRGRNLAYSTCRSTRDQKLQATLLTVLLVDPLLATAASFDQADMQTDVQFCGMPLRWKVLNAQGTVLQQADAGGIGPGFTTRAANLRLANAARIVLSGPLSALVCPVASQNNEQLTIAAGPLNGPPTQVQTLTPSGTNQYLQSTLDFDVATLQSQGVQKLVVARQGALCSGEFPGLTAHATIASIVLDANVPVQITATSLPGTIAGGAYNASVAVSGGTAPFVWTAAGLPAGLSIDPQTGTLGGSLANPGAFAIALGVTSADGTSAQTTLTLNVVADVAGTYVGSATDLTPPNETFPVTFEIRQSGNLVLLGNFLLELAPSGGLTLLGNTNGDFVLDPAKPITITFSGAFIGNRMEYTAATLSVDSRGTMMAAPSAVSSGSGPSQCPAGSNEPAAPRCLSPVPSPAYCAAGCAARAAASRRPRPARWSAGPARAASSGRRSRRAATRRRSSA